MLRCFQSLITCLCFCDRPPAFSASFVYIKTDLSEMAWSHSVVSSQELRPDTSPIRGVQRVHPGSECHQAWEGVCQALPGLSWWTPGRGELHGQACHEPLHPAVRLLRRGGNSSTTYKCITSPGNTIRGPVGTVTLCTGWQEILSDPQVKVWNLTKRQCVRTLQAHEGFVRGMVVRSCGTSFFTVSATLQHLRGVLSPFLVFRISWFFNPASDFISLGKRLAMTKQSSSGKWRRRVMERKRSLSTLFWARWVQWASAGAPESFSLMAQVSVTTNYDWFCLIVTKVNIDLFFRS